MKAMVRARALGTWMAAASALGACAGDDSATPNIATLIGRPVRPVAPALACEKISAEAMGLPRLRLSAAQAVAAKRDSANEADNYPAHCLVSGTLNERTGSDGKRYAIGFELRLPQAWNRRFFFQGGGGTDGMVLPALGTLMGVAGNALSQGFAVVSMDAGHTSEALPIFLGGSVFGLDPQARIDYGYKALGEMTSAAKQLVEHVYDSTIERSYFVGCSNGGRQAMVAAARFAEQYDGIVAGNPGFNLPKAAVQHAWDFQQLLTVDADDPAAAFTPEEMAFVGERINAKCDALDGASDGLVHDLAACSAAFELGVDVPVCQNGRRTGACLTSLQKIAMRNIMSGPVNGKGEALYSDWPWDPGIGSDHLMTWRGWKLGVSLLGGFSLIRTMGAASLAYVFTAPPTDLQRSVLLDPQPALDAFLTNFDFDLDAPKIYATSGPYTEAAASFMIPPDNTHLTAYAARKGKLIVYHGTADAVFSSNDTLRWYKELNENVPDAPTFARLFLVPGMGHCGGGPATESFDMLSALVDWVEGDVAPDAVLGRVNPDSANLPSDWSKTRTRPLCAYPKHAVLKPGATDLESAASFACQ